MKFASIDSSMFMRNGANCSIFLLKKIRISIFLTFFFKIFSTNIYWGIVTAAFEENNKHNKTLFKLGGTGLGPAIGALLLMTIINSYNSKKIILFFSLLELLSLLTLLYSNTLIVELICEGIIGASDIISMIIAPLWIDRFGIQKQRTLCFILIELAIPLGRCIGYLLLFFFSVIQWKKKLVVVLILILITVTLFFSFPNLYFSSKIQIETESDGRSEKVERKESTNLSIFQIRKSRTSLNNEDQTVRYEIFRLLRNPVFICGIISKMFLVFIQTIFFFRFSSYMIQVLKIEDKLIETAYYIMILFIGPIGGVILGVLITSSRFSYEKKHSGLCLFLLYLLTCLFALAMIETTGKGFGLNFMTNLSKDNITLQFLIFSICLFMFCSSSISITQGIIISSLPSNTKDFGYSFSHLFTLISGVGMSLYIYDYIDVKFKDLNNLNIAMKYSAYSLFVGLFFSFLLMIFNYCKSTKASIEKENGMSKPTDEKENNAEDASRKSKMSRIAEGLGHAYTGYALNIEDNNEEKLDKSYEKEVNLDEINDKFTNYKDDDGFNN